jgi:hypothetical protein
VFPVRYGLNFYINLLRNSVFKALIKYAVDFMFLPAPYYYLKSLVMIAFPRIPC